MNSYKKLEDKLMSLRLPLPQKRLTIARTLQRAATAVGHHHFAQVTEVACGRIEAEMAPREERPRKKTSSGQREERQDVRPKVKNRSKRSERARKKGEGESEDKEEHFASGALGPEERETHDEQGNEGFVFSPEERGRKAENAPRQRSPAEDHARGPEPQHRPQQEGGMQRRFGQAWPEGHPLAPKNHPPQRKRSRRNEDNHRPSHHSGRPHQEDHPQERPRRHGSKDRQHRHHHRSHTRRSSPPPPKKEKLTWKVLLRGFIKGVAAFEMNELQKKQATPEPPPQRPASSGRRKRSYPNIRPPRSPIQAPSSPRNAMGSPTSSHLHSSTPSPQGRPGLRHASSSDLPPLTPNQIHWREVRAREQGQADIMRAEEEAAVRQQEQSQHQTQQAEEGGPLAYGEDPFAGPISPPGPASVQRSENAPETLAATGWSFPANLAASHSPTPTEVSNQTPQTFPPIQTSKPMPPKWGDPIKERENRQKKRND